VARAGVWKPWGSTPRDGSRTDDGYLLEFALAAKEAGASRVRYCDTIGGDSPGRIRERFAKLASAIGIPVETHCHNDLCMAVANSVSGALGDLDAGQDAWINTCVNGIGERAGNADLLSCILAFRYGLGISDSAAIGDPVGPVLGPQVRVVGGVRVRAAAAAGLARGRPQRVRARIGHPRRRGAEGPGGTTSSTTTTRSGRSRPTGSPARAGWCSPASTAARPGSGTCSTGSASRSPTAPRTWRFSLVQLCASATGKPLTDDELRLITGYPRQLALLFPGQLTQAS